MGAIGLNGAANKVNEPTDRTTVAPAGWAPVNTAAIGALLVGGIGLILGTAPAWPCTPVPGPTPS